MKQKQIIESEKDIQRAVLEYLQLLENMGKLYFFRNNSFQGSFQRSNGSQGYIKNNKKGVPDIIICDNGRFVGLEIKGTKGKQSEFQRQAEEAITLTGGQYHIIRSLNDFMVLFQLGEKDMV